MTENHPLYSTLILSLGLSSTLLYDEYMEKETKILLGILGGILIFVIFLSVHFISSINHGNSRNSLGQNPSSVDDRVTKLEQEVNTLVNDVNLISSPSAAINPADSNVSPIGDQLTTLNGTINELNTRVTRLEQGSGASTASGSVQAVNSSKLPLYIPLGSTDPINSESWLSIDSMAVSLNPADYPGYTSIELEVGLRLNAGTGIANVRLFNSTTQTAITASNVSTTSTSFSVLESSEFNLSSGTNLYTVQLLSTLGDTMFVQNARLKINF